MAHYAELTRDNIVVNVITISDENEAAHGGADSDELLDWLWHFVPLAHTFKKTSYNTYGGVHAFGGTPLRKNYAGVGFTYDPVRDAFIQPKSKFPDAFELKEDSCQWKPPGSPPDDGQDYTWHIGRERWELSRQAMIEQ